MANWDFIFAYNQIAADWLREKDCAAPAVCKGNRLPTTGEMKAALEAQNDLILNYPSGHEPLYVFKKGEAGFTIVIRGFDWDCNDFKPDSAFEMRWMCELQAALLIQLTLVCGQLLLWPDTGAPPIIFQPTINAQTIAAKHHCASDWSDFYKEIYRHGDQDYTE